MAIDNFIPEIWAAGVSQAFISNQVVIPTLRTQFTDVVAPGNKIHIINATTPTIVDYAGANRVISPEALADTEVLLAIDQEKAFSVNVDDVDKVQTGSGFNAWVDSAGRALAEDSENYLVDLMVAEGTDGNPGDIEVDTAAKAKTAVRDIRRLMANAKVPTANRYLLVNPDFTDLLIQALDDSSIAGTDDTLRNGVIGRLYGFTVIESPLLSVAGTPAAMGYHQDMVAYANQIQSLEALRHQTKFADIVRGLNVFGGKVVKSAAVVQYVSVAA
jgi:hypothetical protein